MPWCSCPGRLSKPKDCSTCLILAGRGGGESPRSACWCDVLFDQAWGTANMFGSKVGRGVGFQTNISANNLSLWWVGSSRPACHPFVRLSWGTHELLGIGTVDCSRKGIMGPCWTKDHRSSMLQAKNNFWGISINKAFACFLTVLFVLFSLCVLSSLYILIINPLSVASF